MMNMKCVGFACVALWALGASALETIKLPAVDKTGGKTVMQALQDRKSERRYDSRDLSLKDLSNLLWAANGYNRPGRRTNATGKNLQTTVLYVCNKDGAYRYEAKAHELVPVCEKDIRPALAGPQPFAKAAPVIILITADVKDPSYRVPNLEQMSHYDAGIVSGNIYLACSSQGLSTVCRLMMDRDEIRTALKLSETTLIHLNHPVGYPFRLADED